MSKLLDDIKQCITYSREFRIAAPKWWDLTNAMSIENMMELMRSPASGAQPDPVEDKKLVNLAVEMGTTLWRLRRRAAAAADPLPEMKKVLRDIEGMEDALRQANIVIKDPCGQPYADGMSLKVLARQKTPGLSSEMVVETIKPTIFRGDTLIQSGEVIVGVPESDPANIKREHAG